VCRRIPVMDAPNTPMYYAAAGTIFLATASNFFSKLLNHASATSCFRCSRRFNRRMIRSLSMSQQPLASVSVINRELVSRNSSGSYSAFTGSVKKLYRPL
jgi:hypothetical protein